MENYSQHISAPVFREISLVADQLGVECYVIGGFVRDLMLGRHSKDIDIMTVGRGIELAELVAGVLNSGKQLSVYKNFGTAMLRWRDLDIEFVGARKESYRSDSRKPIVEDGTLDDDLNRRDFTINAMAISLNQSSFGELTDKFGGQQDLANKIIRTPLNPDITYSDDPLRMLRAIRFATQLDFMIEEESLASITRNAHRITIISRERIADELNKVILSPKPSKGFKLMFNTGLLHHFFPEMVALHGVDYVDGHGHKDNFYHTLQVLDNLSEHTDDLWLRWSAILHDIAKPPTKRYDKQAGWTFHGHEDLGAHMVPKIFRKLSLPLNEKMKYVQKLVRLHLRPIALVKEEITDSALRRLLFEAGDDLEDLMQLCRADITSKNPNKVQRYLRNYEILKVKLAEVEEKDRVRNFQPPVTGEVIMETFGIGPCKQIGDLKNAVKEAILEGTIENDPAQAFRFMLEEARKMGLEPVKHER